MSYLIEQTAEQTSAAFHVMSQVDLAHIHLIKSTAFTELRPSVEVPNLYVDLIHSPESKTSVDEASLSFLTSFSLVIRSEDSRSSAALIEVSAVFEARYEIEKPGYQPSDAELDAFRRGNVVFNCWPYFREYVQSTFVRMGLPPPRIPFLRIVPKALPKSTKSPQQGQRKRRISKRK